ncbi:hypothetical protein C8J56DRAFT_924427 [Mycena floridula]|nr:hypothetical protein C8J56DRAFT_924427 [Mycena floridula]
MGHHVSLWTLSNLVILIQVTSPTCVGSFVGNGQNCGNHLQRTQREYSRDSTASASLAPAIVFALFRPRPRPPPLGLVT